MVVEDVLIILYDLNQKWVGKWLKLLRKYLNWSHYSVQREGSATRIYINKNRDKEINRSQGRLHRHRFYGAKWLAVQSKGREKQDMRGSHLEELVADKEFLQLGARLKNRVLFFLICVNIQDVMTRVSIEP